MSHELPSFMIDAGELLQHVTRVVYRAARRTMAATAPIATMTRRRATECFTRGVTGRWPDGVGVLASFAVHLLCDEHGQVAHAVIQASEMKRYLRLPCRHSRR